MIGAELFGRIAAPDAAGWAAVFAAPFIGSFLGVLVRRLPEGKPIVWARSRCEACDAVLQPRDLLPLVSWLGTSGRCRFCSHPLGSFYPAIELAAVAVAGAAAACDHGAGVWLDCVLGWWLLALAWIDWRHWLLPDRLTLPLVLVGLAAAAAFDRANLLDRALGAAAGYLALRVVAITYRRLRGHEGLGIGDAKLLAASGAWVGAAALAEVVLFAAVAGLVTAAGLRLVGIRLGLRSALPFGPFLALGTWLVWMSL
ncbi:MAG TPA: A24 family peptidase [Stellaceae bacterium]|nr:A24 family peptidase [Stellaceae bacterium]